MTALPTIELAALATACGGDHGRREIVQPHPADWDAREAPHGYKAGIPPHCTYSVPIGEHVVERRVRSPRDCFGG